MNKKCVVCGSDFEAKTVRAKYCCRKCANHSRFIKTQEEVHVDHEKMKIEIVKWYKKGLNDSEIAMKVGKSTSWVWNIRHEMGLPRQGLKKSLEKEKRKQELAQMEVRFCKKCGSYFYPIRVNQLFCSKTCERSKSHQIHDIKRKGRIKAAYVDDIALYDLYKKEDGICYLCGEKCDFHDYKYINGHKHVMGNYPSRDHIKPLIKGGEHSWDNVRLAHIRCNASKGAKYG